MKRGNLKRCPCGKVPEFIHIMPGSSSKYAYATGSCCDEWHIEFRTNYEQCNALIKLAEKAWNEAPRGVKND